ncbi:hypothetical protein CYMTET_19110 [Cymbomonas tetramitiformis]|uniref:Uncharacterized protein n=1 Tax=Cymbomonas tetramitiformis TaxID=36881 RepID=A0AAE0G7B0_9CHLO|nr:hypothetical protein CYMTET_19110 [Cymbomonas tetramitiformis]
MARQHDSSGDRQNVKNARTEAAPRMVNGKQPGMQVEPVLDLGQGNNPDFQDAIYRFVGACMSQGSSGQWHAILMSEKQENNMTEYVMFQTPLLQNRHVMLKRMEHYCDSEPVAPGSAAVEGLRNS